VRDLLVRSEPDNNIFSDKIKPYNNDYFKTLFRRFKQLNTKIDKDVTLYSFRHSAALNIFKRTGSLTKLQKAMGHSSLKVSLTYLRGLEVAELTEEDMPQV
jgi:integrase